MLKIVPLKPSNTISLPKSNMYIFGPFICEFQIKEQFNLTTKRTMKVCENYQDLKLFGINWKSFLSDYNEWR